MLKESDGPPGFSFQKFKSRVLYYRIFFYETNPNSICPHMESIQIDSSLHVKLQHKGSHIPLPEWFKRSKYKVNSVSILVNFVSYMHNFVEMNPTTVLDEMYNIRSLYERLESHIPLKHFVFLQCNDILLDNPMSFYNMTFHGLPCLF